MTPDQMTDTLGEYEFEFEGDPFLGGLLGKVAGSTLPGLLGEEERDTMAITRASSKTSSRRSSPVRGRC